MVEISIKHSSLIKVISAHLPAGNLLILHPTRAAAGYWEGWVM